MDTEIAARLRREYEAAGLSGHSMAADPFEEFRIWFAGATDSGIEEPNAFVLATADEAGRPSARAVLMKEFSESGVVFYTGMASRKSDEMGVNSMAAATFVWVPLHRQVRFEGTVARVADEEADVYWATRPRGAQIAAHASEQSRRVPSREYLEERFSELERLYSGDVPRPETWGGWRLAPTSVEFWQGRPNRFHDRIRYELEETAWSKVRLAP